MVTATTDYPVKLERWKKTERKAHNAMEAQAWSIAASCYKDFLKDVSTDLDDKDINVLWVKRHYSEALRHLGHHEAANDIQEGIMRDLSHPNSDEEKLVLYDVLYLRMDYARILRLQPTTQNMETAGEVLSVAIRASRKLLGEDHEFTKALSDARSVNDQDWGKLFRRDEARRKKRERLAAAAAAKTESVKEVAPVPSNPTPAVLTPRPQDVAAEGAAEQAFAAWKSWLMSIQATAQRGETVGESDTEAHGPRGRRLLRVNSELQDAVSTLVRSSSTPRVEQEDRQSLLDFNISDANLWSGNEENRQDSDRWIAYWLAKTHRLMQMRTPLKSGPGQRVRIAILDTGLNRHHREVAALLSQTGDERRIQAWKSWLPDPADPSKTLPGDEDDVGHGTHCAMVAHRIAPDADLFIARIFKNRNNVGKDYVKEAIDHAINEWQVDIISMSFSLARENVQGKEAAEAAINAHRGRALFLAAASNDGKNSGRMFPASHPDVLCIHCCDAKGYLSRLNPGIWKDDTNFSTLGVYVNAPHKGQENRRSSGTSVATAVAAGIVALVLEFSRQKEVKGQRSLEHVREKLKTKQAMTRVFRLMQDRNEVEDKTLYLRPWQLLSADNNAGDGIEARKDIAAAIERELYY